MPTLLSTPMAEERASREMIPDDSQLFRFIWVNPARMHGEPCFVGTRVPVQYLFDHLRAGDNIERFREGFPDVTRELAVGVIDLAASGLLEGLRNL
jgi:uncharacterized protein (DUF433 family)